MKFIGPSKLTFDLVLCIQDTRSLFDLGVDRHGVDGVLPLVERFEEEDPWRTTNTTRVQHLLQDPHFPSYAAGIPLFCNGMPVALGQFQAHLILCKHQPFAVIDSLEDAVTWMSCYCMDPPMRTLS